MIRLEIYQETAHFRIPTIGNPYLSYPLPPPSTVYGFLRHITNKESINFENTELSIQGIYKSVSFEKEQLFLKTKKGLKTNIVPIQKLHQCNWIIHIKSPSPLEGNILKALENFSGVLRLGRQEDLIIDIKINRDLEEKPLDTEDDFEERLYIYKRWEINEDADGSLFSMALDTVVDENLKIIGYKPVNLIYSNVRRIKPKLYDGKYVVQWL